MARFSQNISDLLVCTKYKLHQKIDSGGYGEIYKVIDIENNEVLAAKVELQKGRRSCHQYLDMEYEVYRKLRGYEGIPKVRWYGHAAGYKILIMDMLGPSLDSLFRNVCHSNFSAETIVIIAYQMISRLQSVHRNNYIHRDLKPLNFLVGNGEKDHVVFLIDFGLASQYIDRRTDDHISLRTNVPPIGTTCFMSRNTLVGLEQSRRDDMESLGYVLLYFIRRGCLPWRGIKRATDTQYREKIIEMKCSLTIDDMCAGHPLQRAMCSYFSHCLSLSFEDSPDYNYLRTLFQNEINKPLSFGDLDWIKYRKFRQVTESVGAVPRCNFSGAPVVNYYNPPANAPITFRPVVNAPNTFRPVVNAPITYRPVVNAPSLGGTPAFMYMPMVNAPSTSRPRANVPYSHFINHHFQ